VHVNRKDFQIRLEDFLTYTKVKEKLGAFTFEKQHVSVPSRSFCIYRNNPKHGTL